MLFLPYWSWGFIFPERLGHPHPVFLGRIRKRVHHTPICYTHGSGGWKPIPSPTIPADANYDTGDRSARCSNVLKDV